MPLNDEQTVKILETLARLDERTERMDKEISGNGQPGIKQRVEDLEGSRAKAYGIGSAVVFLGGVAEWFFHRGH